MRFREGDVLERGTTETLGKRVESRMRQFLDGAFNSMLNIEKTKKQGENDDKGIDLVIEFEGGYKLAVDVTTASERSEEFKRKWKSMISGPLTFVKAEENDDGELVAGTEMEIPRAIIRVSDVEWEEYCDNVDKMGGTIFTYLSDERVREIKEEIIDQMMRQFEIMLKDLKGHQEYENKVEPIREILLKELDEIEDEKKRAQ